MEGQKNRGTPKEKIKLWMIFFLDSLERLIQKLEAKYEIYAKNGRYLKERHQKIIDYIKENSPVKLADLTRAFPQIAKNTLKKDLQNMKAQNLIIQLGEYRGAVYSVNEE